MKNRFGVADLRERALCCSTVTSSMQRSMTKSHFISTQRRKKIYAPG